MDELIARALAEDVGPGDVTTEGLIDRSVAASGRLVAKEAGVLAGMPIARRLIERAGEGLRLEGALSDGAELGPGTEIGVVAGPCALMLTAERTLLNFLQGLSGIATLTRRYVDAVAGTGAAILDTRKTLPGWRALSKYAVVVGGGRNHRMGLYDQVLIKDNHLAASGLSAGQAVAAARERAGGSMRVEVEVRSPGEARAAAAAGADVVMLDNMAAPQMREAVVAIRELGGGTTIEASGSIDLERVRAVAETGADWISVGAITHSAPALDISLDVEAR
ncbi:MAG: carboxylating nicotinate-nucleotide diphosphorylase [bacterium]